MPPPRSQRSFTLIELLIVVAVIAVLATVVIIVLNPAELLRQSRDSNRISDMRTMSSALNLYGTDQSGASSFSLGSSSVLYISVPDPTATTTAGDECQGLGMPALPSGWTYHCASSSTYRNANGTGWLPVAFSAISSGNPLGTLPVDPVNQTSTYEYYTYATNGNQWQMYGLLESQKYQNQEASTGGYDPASYKVGTNVNIAPFAAGMAGYWPFSEGSGGTTADLSGYGNTGTLSDVGWATGIVGNALAFNGSTGTVNLATDTFGASPFTLTAWLYASSTGEGGSGDIVSDGAGFACAISGWNLAMTCSNNNFAVGSCNTNANAVSLGQWYFFAAARNAVGQYTLYLNGAQNGSGNQSCGTLSGPYNLTIGSRTDGVYTWGGFIDDFRVYGRELTPTEIQAIYGTKQ